MAWNKIFGYQLKHKKTGEQYLSGQDAFPNFKGKEIQETQKRIQMTFPEYEIQRVNFLRMIKHFK